MMLVNEALNNSTSLNDSARRTSEQAFFKTQVNIRAKDYKSFGCAVFALNTDLQQQNRHQKWKERAKSGIYLGKSPRHVINVSLVLSLNTNLVSPQFHVKHDPYFDVIQQQISKKSWICD